MKRTGKIISLLLTFVLVLDLFFPASFSPDGLTDVQAALEPPTGETSGECGTDIRWKLEVDRKSVV